MPEKMSLDEFLGRRGLQSPIGDYDLDKWRLPHGETQRQRTKRLQESQAARETYSSQRKAAIAEYEDKIKRGEILPKTAVERLVDRAHGHPDNPSVQAARRSLEKRGIDWQSGKSLKELQLQAKKSNALWSKLESYGLHAGGWNAQTGMTAVCAATAPDEVAKILGYVDADLKIEWTAPIAEIAAATLDAANAYYVEGQAYLVEGQHLCICHRWRDVGTETAGINFEGIKRNLFCDPERMGTFLPGIASKDLEISKWPPENEATRRQTDPATENATTAEIEGTEPEP